MGKFGKMKIGWTICRGSPCHSVWRIFGLKQGLSDGLYKLDIFNFTRGSWVSIFQRTLLGGAVDPCFDPKKMGTMTFLANLSVLDLQDRPPNISNLPKCPGQKNDGVTANLTGWKD